MIRVPAEGAGRLPDAPGILPLLELGVIPQESAPWQWTDIPRSPGPDRLDVLHEAAEPARRPQRLPVENGRMAPVLTSSRHEVTLVEAGAVVDEAPPRAEKRSLLGRQPR
ncbi:hypothetical protein HLK59_45660 [Streptomyces sp. S3(2020)]|uniref:hypothetical protein n=1 Tax=Streptomyces sp. S3(2020) TaxID=2732044 RepID=UPI0014884468|nr:hypothetical protein [Streptomyces sp. S3(2020)]NNN37496.1 hypothetical protein [Streptomyces sp. S3(2020)]